MKKRLLVMNGQKLVQNESAGVWKTEKVSKAEGIKPGIYNLYNTVDPDLTKDNIGEIIYIDKIENVLYQQKGSQSQYIKHDLNCFNQIPKPGYLMNIKYENNKVSTTEVSKKLIQTNKL